MADRSQWPAPARTMAGAVEEAVTAASDGARPAFDEALAVLVRVDRAQLATLLGTATRELLERAHPDGLDAEGAEIVLAAATKAARPWFPEVDDDLLLRALTGALGIGEIDDARVDPDAVLAHGLVLLAELARVTGVRPRAAVDAAMAELIRAQTVELP